MSQYLNNKHASFTWEDYQNWPDDQRWELVDGEAYAMSPSPQTRHQLILSSLHAQIYNYLKNKSCKVIPAPMDVKLSETDIVQPDILVVCDPNQIKQTHIDGPPTLVIEILSPFSLRHDRLRKTQLYAKFGVKEYWIVTPYPSLMEVLLLSNHAYEINGVFSNEDNLSSPTFSDLNLNLAAVFNFPIPPDESIDEIKESTPEYAVNQS